MKRYLAVILLGFAVVLGFATRHRGGKAGVAGAFETLRPSEDAKLPASRQQVASARVSSRATAGSSAEERADVMARIDEAVKSYEPAAVKAIAPYLTSTDRDLRSAAREGLIQLGEPDGIAVLRLAATRMSDPAETNACREAADFLELPSWSETDEARETVANLLANPEPTPPPP
ncbi:hypothetical protein KBB96_07795 [Luteolibacter ambystomatis]|uniref:HEAT repeat domain-containing protein n=1 Tax=Luteolibacter ambystomatis TaxID=2824561 RepID=A0A975J2G1_9BACT|nr:hypothetical protein [Luteolibacter ambystomatis]QUE52784.1 hypothetical protein KBB96_07795 [Luteolibacter ambystomatis]